MDPNEYQIGGSHYQGEYQHWDFVCDTNLHYLLGCATKYIARWRKKNGIEDLRKASHYISKAVESKVKIPVKPSFELIVKFCGQLHDDDSEIIIYIVHEYFGSALSCIQKLIEEIECGPGPDYIKG